MEHTVQSILADPSSIGIVWENRQWSKKAGNTKVAIRRPTPVPVIKNWRKFGEAFPDALTHHANANIRVMTADVSKAAVAESKDDTHIKTRAIENFMGINHRGGATQKVLTVPPEIDDATMKILASANPGVKIVREAPTPA